MKISEKRLPKHRNLKKIIESQIKDLGPGGKLPPIRELKKELSTSQATLERALQELENEGRIVKKWGSGIFVSDHVQKSTNVIGVVVPDFTTSFTAILLESIEAALAESDYKTIICNSYKKFANEIELVHSLKGKIDGAIIAPNTRNIFQPGYAEFFVELQQSLPMVVVNVFLPGVQTDFVTINNYKAFSDLAQILKNSNLTDDISLLFLGGGIISLERLHGFESVIPLNNNARIFNIQNNKSSDFLTKDNLKPRHKGKPEVIVCADAMFLPQLEKHVIQSDLRIPEDVIVCAVVEEGEKEKLDIPIVAVVKQTAELGASATDILFKKIENEKAPPLTRVDVKIEIDDVYKHVLKPQ
ncbi:MAG: GntR family transcriptional regulator [Planctomycetota bacterium]|jgi:DNA-binding LacI/PurR family transcriptional regulator